MDRDSRQLLRVTLYTHRSNAYAHDQWQRLTEDRGEEESRLVHAHTMVSILPPIAHFKQNSTKR